MYAVCAANGRPILTGYVSWSVAAACANDFTNATGRPHHVRLMRRGV